MATIKGIDEGVSTSNGFSTGTMAETWGTGTGCFVAVVVAYSSNAVSASMAITGGGVTWAGLQSVDYQTRRKIWLFEASAVPTDTALTITASGGSGDFKEIMWSAFEIAEYDNTDISVAGPLANSVETGSTSLATATVGTPTADQLNLLLGACEGGSVAFTSAANHTNLFTPLTGGTDVRSFLVATTLTDDTPGVTWNSSSVGAAVIAARISDGTDGSHSGGGSAAITGTATASIIESDVVTGGKTIDWTLTGDTFIAAGTGPIGTTAQSLALIQTLDSAQAEAGGWDAEVKANMVATDLTRVSDTVARLTLSAEAAYAITAQETITVGDIPNAILTTSTSDITPSANTFTVTPDDAVPDAFSFTDQTDVAVSTVITSAGITVAGINVPSVVTCTGGTCSINGGAYSTSPGNCVNGDTITARHTSSASNNTAVDTIVTIGGVSDTFTSTTEAAPSTSTITTAAITGGASLTGLEWAVFSSQDLSTATLLDQGSGETTDGSGVLVLDVAGSGATNGQLVWYVIKNTADTIAAQGPATVVVT